MVGPLPKSPRNDKRLEELMRCVILESPFRGTSRAETEDNIWYAKEAMLDSLRRGESPIASHLLWPGILDDAVPAERLAGIEAGLAWGMAAEATVVYIDRGISPGMQVGIDRAIREGRPVEHRRLTSAIKEKGRPKVSHPFPPRLCGRF
jgi:hypothetical protein